MITFSVDDATKSINKSANALLELAHKLIMSILFFARANILFPIHPSFSSLQHASSRSKKGLSKT
jgi:hypothetical protein